MNEVKIFNNPKFGDVRVFIVNNEPWFVGKDVALLLGYAKPENALSTHVDDEDKTITLIQGTGSNYKSNTTIINESGMYSLVFGSRLKTAKDFKHWVTSDVLPSIRKTGGYIAANDNMTESEIMARAVLVANSTIEKRNERIRQLEAENAAKSKAIEEAQPSIVFTQAVSGSVSSCLVGELAKLIDQNGFPMGEKRLFRWLRDNGYLGTKGERYNIPNQRYIEKGFFELKKGTRSGNNGVMHTTVTTKVTGKGQVYFINLFAKKSGKEAAIWNR